MTGPGIQLRPARSHDMDAAFGLFAQVQSIHAETHPEVFRPPARDATFERYFEAIVRDPDQNLVFACVNGVEVGYVEYFLGFRPETVFQLERRAAYIHSLVVAKDRRRTGCATLLIDHVKEQARHQDIANLGIDVWSFNHAARAFFEKAGFKASKEFMWLDL